MHNSMTQTPSTIRRLAARHALPGALIALSAATLVACGGGNGAAPVATQGQTDLGNTIGTGDPSSTAPATAALTVSGRVINAGYLGNTKVCLDVNDNNACDTDEPT